MKLTDAEIRTLWRNKAHTPHNMLKCLADLNACDYMTMRDKCAALGLISADEYPRKKGKRGTGLWDQEELDKLTSLRESGLKYREIGIRMGRSESGVRQMLKKIGMV